MNFDEALDEANSQLNKDLDSVELTIEYWAIKLIFVSEDSDKRVGVLAPRLFPLEEEAKMMAMLLCSDSMLGPSLMAEWLSRGDIVLPEDDETWQPLYAGAVKMAAVPF